MFALKQRIIEASLLVYLVLPGPHASATDVSIYDDGQFALWCRENLAGVDEAPIPVYYQETLKGNYKALQTYDRVPGRDSWPETFVNLVANAHLRSTYQMNDGATGSLGTSVVGTVSYRSTTFQKIPTGTRADVFTGGPDRIRIVRTGLFGIDGTDATAESTSVFPDPPIGSTAVSLTTRFIAKKAIILNSALLHNDAFRLVGLSSSFVSSTQYDANVIRWKKDPGDVDHLMRLTNSTDRDKHLFSSPIEITKGGFFELVKETGSSWNTTSPSIRMNLIDLNPGITGRVGIQGWLANTQDPNDDSLSLWLEWMDAPTTIPPGAEYGATFTVVATPPVPSRLINLSILTTLTSVDDSFTMGYVVGGSGTSGTKPLVIRAAGPSLGALGVPNTLDDPKLELFAGATKVGENDNWGGSVTLANAMSAVGAFAYNGPTSRDAAAMLSVASGDNSVKVSGFGSGTGAVIAEIYDATPATNFTAATPRLVNVSVLKQLGAGFIAGFVVGGNGTKNVLVRAIGPTLGTAFGIGGVVSDPQLTLNFGQTVVGSNDNWGGGATLASAFSSVGAFALPTGSRDAAVVASLSPGNYTVQVSSVAGTTGLILVEIYELP